MTQADDNTEFSEAKLWNLPSVDDALAQDEGKTNALNRPINRWKFEPPEEEEADLSPLTAEDIEEIRQSAYKDGFEQGKQEGFEKGHAEGTEKGTEEGLAAGKEQGYQAGLDEAKTEIEAALAQLQGMIDQLQSPLASVNSELKKELTLLSLTVSKAIVNQQVSIDESIVQNAVEQALETLPLNESETKVFAHPEQLGAINQYIEKLHQNDADKAPPCLQLIADESVGLGGCKVVSQNNAVDMSIQRRSEQVISQIMLAQGISNDPRAD